MTYSALELYASAKLDCGVADLSMLEELYSTLGEDCVDPDQVSKDNETLSDILYELYNTIQDRIEKYIHNFIDNTAEDIEDTLDDYMNTNFDGTDEEKGKETQRVIDIVKDELSRLEGTSCYVNSSATSFDNDIRQIVDWDKSLRDNALELIEYWVK